MSVIEEQVMPYVSVTFYSGGVILYHDPSSKTLSSR